MPSSGTGNHTRGAFESALGSSELGPGNVGAFNFAFGCIELLWTIGILGYLRIARNRALRGDAMSATTLVLPAYAAVLYAEVVTDAFAGLLGILVPHRLEGHSLGESMLFGVAEGLKRLPMEGVLFFMLSTSAGMGTLRRAIAGSALVALFTTGLMTLVFHLPSREGDDLHELAFVIEEIWQSLMMVLYLVVWKSPTSWFFRRPAVRPYAAFWVVTRATFVLSVVLRHAGQDVGFLFYMVASGLLIGAVRPYVVYRTLALDSLYWQGLWAVKGATERSGLASVTQGIVFSGASINTLTKELDSLKVHDVKFLNFAYIKMQDQIGSGGQARVFRAQYRGREVAVKMIFCMELTPEVMESFAREAALLQQLSGDAVVHVYGIVCRPPSVGLVLEFCHNGSLWDYVQAEKDYMTWREKLQLCLGAAKGVAALHRKSVLHKDLKAFNFLVTVGQEVKIADLGTSTQIHAVAARRASSVGARRGSLFRTKRGLSADVFYPTAARLVEKDVDVDSVDIMNAGTVNWTAPEVLAGSTYTMAADVYALGLVMWEVITGKLPFDTPELNRMSIEQLAVHIVRAAARSTANLARGTRGSHGAASATAASGRSGGHPAANRSTKAISDAPRGPGGMGGTGEFTSAAAAPAFLPGTQSWVTEVLGLPDGLPTEFVLLLQSCWEPMTQLRPTAAGIAAALEEMVAATPATPRKPRPSPTAASRGRSGSFRRRKRGSHASGKESPRVSVELTSVRGGAQISMDNPLLVAGGASPKETGDHALLRGDTESKEGV